MADKKKEDTLVDRAGNFLIGAGGAVNGALMSHEAFIARYTPKLARVVFGGVGPAMVAGGAALMVDALSSKAKAVEAPGKEPESAPADSPSVLEVLGNGARIAANFLTGGFVEAAIAAVKGGEETRDALRNLRAERDARPASNLAGAKFMVGVAGDVHPGVSKMYEKVDTARFHDFLLRKDAAIDSVRRSFGGEGKAYLNDQAKTKAERAPKPVKPAAPRAGAAKPSSDGTTAAYVRAGRNGGIVQVQSYTTPRR